MMQSGLDQLCQAIEQAKVQTSAQVVLIGMEPTSHYFENPAASAQACPAGNADQQLCGQAEP
jgi:pyrimidine deaminase RibD-like protein